MKREEILEIRQKLKDDFQHYASKCLKIRSKSGDIIPFVFNRAQKYVHAKLEEQLTKIGRVRALNLKGRQQGMSTLIGGRFYHKVTHRFGAQAFILAHALDATNNLYKMAQRYYEHCPTIVRPEVSTSNAKELIFGKLESGYKVGTAENKSVGRSATIQLLHGSETAFWSNTDDHSKGIMQAVPDAHGTEIILESTANGVGNYFHQMWQNAEAGLTDYIPIFVPWYWQDEYVKPINEADFQDEPNEANLIEIYGLSLQQIAWRRAKIIDLSLNGQDGEKSFMQEYPCIVGSERVGTDNGLIPITEVISNFQTNQGSIKRQWCTGIKETIEIETALGYTLKCTPSHRVLCNDNEFREAHNLFEFDIQLTIPKFANNLYKIKWQSMPCISNELIIDEDFALFLGFFMGDGSFSGETLSIVFDKKDQTSIEEMKRLGEKLFGRYFQERQVSENGIELRFSYKPLKRLFLELGIIELKATYVKRKVCVPECIWKSPRHIIKQFLKGLFDSDGFAGYSTPKIAFFSKHPQFVKDIQLILLGFGITSKRNHVEKKAGSGHFYMGNELVLRGSESRLFGQEIGFVSERKNNRIKEWLEQGKKGRTAKNIVFYDRVIKITHLEKQLVYDIEMNNDLHIFDVNGILVHNCNANEAFQLTGEDTFISSDIVMTARKCQTEKYGKLVLGVDPARFGDDRTAIIRRQGRVVYGLETYVKKDTMEVTGIVAKLIAKENPFKVFVDVGGLGAGVVDRLIELGFRDVVVPVNAGAKPRDANKYKNKRAEMWGELKEWLINEPSQVPDNNELHADLCGVKYKFNSSSQLVIEPKEDMKKRGIRSPDCADAMCLTFAYPESAFQENLMQKDKIAASIMSKQKRSMELRKQHGRNRK